MHASDLVGPGETQAKALECSTRNLPPGPAGHGHTMLRMPFMHMADTCMIQVNHLRLYIFLAGVDVAALKNLFSLIRPQIEDLLYVLTARRRLEPYG